MLKPGVNIFDVDAFIDADIAPSRLIFKNPSDFSQYVEVVAARDGTTLTQVVLDYCDMRDIDYTDISKLLSKTLKEKLLYEMQQSGLLAPTNELSFE